MSSPRHYFLNERHQLAPADKLGGGGKKTITGIEWKSHGSGLSKKLCALRQARQQSSDPTSGSRLFIVAKQALQLSKNSKAKDAVNDQKTETPDFAGKDSQVLKRMGLDLVAVQPDGAAIVHASLTQIEQIEKSLEMLSDLSQREKNKWATITDFYDVSLDYKTSESWWPDAASGEILDAVIDLQPLITSLESDLLIKALKFRLGQGEKLLRIGVEFTGRRWIGAQLRFSTIKKLCHEFQAIYSIHPIPIAGAAAVEQSLMLSVVQPDFPTITVDPRSLPCVGVVDTGIPSDHLYLGPFRVGQKNGDYTPGEVTSSHGSRVASRVVFGEVGNTGEVLKAECSVYDLRLGDMRISGGSTRIFEDAVLGAIADVVENAPNVRVFNLSFDASNDLAAFEGSYRDSVLRRLADLDNRCFELDILCVIAAGNSSPGTVPIPTYPQHVDAPEWSLRTWSRCFNAITCGGTSEDLNAEGVAREVGAPSPFTRIGPGFANSPKPDFSASAGNTDTSYAATSGRGLGVLCCNEEGVWEDHPGTSFAAPLLAREAARTMAFLQSRCAPGTKPFAALVKAVLALCATPPTLPKGYQKLASRTLGFGSVKLEDVIALTANKALFFWQGIISNEDEILTVQLPLPGEWIRASTMPQLRLVCAWETPVNAAVEHVWACRRVDITFRHLEVSEALPSKKKTSKGYPLVERIYSLGEAKAGLEKADYCLLELKYTHLEMAEYPAGQLEFSPQQRIGIAFELSDQSPDKVSPHPFVQSLPVAASLNQLSSVVPAARHAISIRSLG